MSRAGQFKSGGTPHNKGKRSPHAVIETYNKQRRSGTLAPLESVEEA